MATQYPHHEALATFNLSRHEIRGVQLVSDDLVPLQAGRKLKLTGTLLNAVGALIQLVAEKDGNTDFAVFSTWLSPLIAREVAQGKAYGTIMGLIEDACQGQSGEMLLAKARWMFPMYGSNPPHWILGWMELGARELHIFDSCPELQSYMWAEPALLELGETVYATLGKPAADLASWRVLKHSPPVLFAQMNAWACGIFVIDAMDTLARGERITVVTNKRTALVQEQTLNLVLTNLAFLEPPPPSIDASVNPSEDVDVPAAVNPFEDADVPATMLPKPAPSPTIKVPDIFSTDVEMPPYNTDIPSESQAIPPKPPQEVTTQPAKKKRAKKSTAEERKAKLSDNKWTGTVEAHRVYCTACGTWIALDLKQQYKLDNWENHENVCPGITGKLRVRQSAKKPGKVAYVSRLVNATPSIASLFNPGPIKNPPPMPPAPATAPKSCKRLSGPEYKEYINRTETRSMGGISPTLRGRIARQIFFHKKFPPLKNEPLSAHSAARELLIPAEGNDCIASPDWTDSEHEKLHEALRGFSRWVVYFATKSVASAQCEGVTTNPAQICNSCLKVSKDDSLLRSIRRKNEEALLPVDEQHEILMRRNKYSSRRFADVEARKLDDLLKDPLVFRAFKYLERDESTECFLQLYEASLNGKLKKYETFTQLCKVVGEMMKRDGSDKKYGIRYPVQYLNFMVLMRSYGGNSARQYGIMSGEFPCPSPRHLRSIVAKSEDALQNPYLIYENVARVKRLMDSLKYGGPIAVAGDCTKVRKRLTYSNDFGGHILGAVLPLDECIAEDPEDISRVIERIIKAKAEATQVRAILVKIPVPQVPPIVVALIPTDGKDDAPKIVELQLKLLAMAAELSIDVISFAADGAASELAAQKIMDSQTSPTRVTYEYALYGISLSAPVMPTGPLVAIQDPSHAKKTGRNQPQQGTKTASLGSGYVTNHSLVRLYKTLLAGLLASDIMNPDRQDDGPARRLMHYIALLACTEEIEGNPQIRADFQGLFVYLFVLGTLFDAWLNRTMTVANRVLAVLRARFWLHFWRAHVVNMAAKYPDLYSTTRSFISPASFHIFNRLCDTLLLLVIIYARYYPNQAFCPWLFGTDFVEHFFGLARMMLPNFTYAEFLKMVQHIMVRQRILLSGTFKEKRERNSGVGYVLDFDASVLTAEDRKIAQVTLTNEEMNVLVEIAFKEASLICTQLLHIPAPKPTQLKPVLLTPLGAPASNSKPSKRSQGEDVDLESDFEFDSDEEDADVDAEVDDAEPPTGHGECRDVSLAAHDAARYSALCEDYDSAVAEAESDPIVYGPPPPPLAPPTTVTTPSDVRPVSTIPSKSDLIDETGKLSIALILQARLHLQAGTTTKSEKTLRIDSKYAISRISRGIGLEGDDDTNPEKMTLQEASHLARVAQDGNTALQAGRFLKSREIRWKNIASKVQKLVNVNLVPNIASKNVHALNPLIFGSFTLMWNGKRFYIGEVLDVYKKGLSSRHGSVTETTTTSGLSYLSLRVYLELTSVCASFVSADAAEEDDDDTEHIMAPPFSCYTGSKGAQIYTHAQIDHLLFNLGPNVFERAEPGTAHRVLKSHAASRWMALTRGVVVEELAKIIKIRIRKGDTGR
ncbi:hypothetical protein C8J57DRAFT_1066950 [Mycena rebaudengoi]|nr:hypothetical protein C8J57DRAFT_1066950 [Mycena rebaudengoi]